MKCRGFCCWTVNDCIWSRVPVNLQKLVRGEIKDESSWKRHHGNNERRRTDQQRLVNEQEIEILKKGMSHRKILPFSEQPLDVEGSFLYVGTTGD